jgi:NitT/TauT family transport system ATP-binding protein
MRLEAINLQPMGDLTWERRRSAVVNDLRWGNMKLDTISLQQAGDQTARTVPQSPFLAESEPKGMPAPSARAARPVLPAICLQNVDVTFSTEAGPVKALSGVNLTVKKEEFVSIVGPSGCGKSTILRIASSLIHPSSGEVTVLGSDAEEARLNHSFGFVFQSSVMLPWLTALENVQLPLDVIGTSSGKAPITPTRLLEMVGLKGYENLYPRQLSGGMRQRVAIARALSFNPPVLLMDEPFAAVDALTRQKLHTLLMEIWNNARKTVLFITHDVYEAVMLSDRVLVMSRSPGRIAAEIPITLPRPRNQAIKNDPEYQRLCAQILDLLMQE